MLNNIKFGYILLIANYLSIIIIGLLTKRKNKSTFNELKIDSTQKNSNFGTNLKFSIEGAVNTTLNVGAFVIIFSVVISIIKKDDV